MASFEFTPEDAKKLKNLDAPGVKELPCGCICEVVLDAQHVPRIKVLQSCPDMEWLFVLAREKEPDDKYLFSPGDDIVDHVFEGIMPLEEE